VPAADSSDDPRLRPDFSSEWAIFNDYADRDSGTGKQQAWCHDKRSPYPGMAILGFAQKMHRGRS